MSIVRFHQMENVLPQSRPPTENNASNWIGIASVWLTVASFVAAALVSFKWTLIVSALVVVAMVVFLWSVGVRKKRARGESDARR